MITIVAAIGKKNELAKEDRMLWSLPDDYQRFKTLTKGYPVIMGRKSLEMMLDVLDDRDVFVVTRNQEFSFPKVKIAHSIEEAIQKAEEVNKQIFIIGGGQIYDLGIEFADRIEMTRVHACFSEANVFFPFFSTDNWRLIQSDFHPMDANHLFSFTYETWTRK